MKYFSLLLLLIIGGNRASAQDIIYPRKGASIAAKVIEVKPEVISFLKFNDPDSIIYNSQKEFVDSIIYQNGAKDIFTTGRRRPVPPRPGNRIYQPAREQHFFKENSHKVSSGIYLLDNTDRADSSNDINNQPIIAFYGSYEKMFAKNKVGVSFMPFVGANRKAYGGGLGLTLYPRPWNRAVFRTGPQLLLYHSQIKHSYYNNEGGYAVNGIYPTTILTFTYNNGVSVHINKNWGIESDFGFGHVIQNTKRKELDKLRGYGDRHGYLFDDIMVSGRLGIFYRF